MLLVLPAAGIFASVTLVRSVSGTTAVGLIVAILFGRANVFWSVAKSVTLLTMVIGRHRRRNRRRRRIQT